MDINVIYVLDTNFGTIKMRNSFALLHIKKIDPEFKLCRDNVSHDTLFLCILQKWVRDFLEVV